MFIVMATDCFNNVQTVLRHVSEALITEQYETTLLIELDTLLKAAPKPNRPGNISVAVGTI